MMNIVSLSQVGVLVRQGKIGVMPTDTVYGVVALALNQAAVERLYKLKSREVKPGTVIVSSVQGLEALGITDIDSKILQKYWPGAVSIVMPSTAEYLHQGKGSIAVRLPAHEGINNLLKDTGPLLTSSANTPGDPPATTITEAMNYFGESVDFYVDGGYVSNKKSSTIIRLNGEVLREGAVKISNLR